MKVTVIILVYTMIILLIIAVVFAVLFTFVIRKAKLGTIGQSISKSMSRGVQKLKSKKWKKPTFNLEKPTFNFKRPTFMSWQKHTQPETASKPQPLSIELPPKLYTIDEISDFDAAEIEYQIIKKGQKLDHHKTISFGEICGLFYLIENKHVQDEIYQAFIDAHMKYLLKKSKFDNIDISNSSNRTLYYIHYIKLLLQKLCKFILFQVGFSDKETHNNVTTYIGINRDFAAVSTYLIQQDCIANEEKECTDIRNYVINYFPQNQQDKDGLTSLINTIIRPNIDKIKQYWIENKFTIDALESVKIARNLNTQANINFIDIVKVLTNSDLEQAKKQINHSNVQNNLLEMIDIVCKIVLDRYAYKIIYDLPTRYYLVVLYFLTEYEKYKEMSYQEGLFKFLLDLQQNVKNQYNARQAEKQAEKKSLLDSTNIT